MYRIRVEGTVRCAVEDLNPRGRRTILFVHGWPYSREIFEYQYDVLPKYDIRCVSMDLRGYGDSDKPWRGYSYERLADDLCKVIQELDLRNITLCGFSMGGAVCAKYMARHKGFRVCKLVLMGAALPVFVRTAENPTGMTREQVDALIAQIYQDRPGVCASFSRMCFYKETSSAFMQWFINLAFKSAGRSCIEGLVALRDSDLRQDLAQIKVPTAIFHGVCDKVCPFPMAEQMKQRISGSVIVPFERSGHCLFYDEKEKCSSLLVDFVNSNWP